MKKILILFLFATVLFSCQEEPQPEIIDVEQIRAELDEYVKNRAATRSDNSLYEDIVNFLKEKGFVEVDDPNFPKEQNSSARLNCTTTGALLTLGDGCSVFVVEYGAGCAHAGCVGNSWKCGNETAWEEVYYC